LSARLIALPADNGRARMGRQAAQRFQHGRQQLDQRIDFGFGDEFLAARALIDLQIPRLP